MRSLAKGLAEGLTQPKPKKGIAVKLEPFYGITGPGKIDVRRFINQVMALENTHTEEVIKESLMKCLKDEAYQTADALPDHLTWKEILDKLKEKYTSAVARLGYSSHEPFRP